MYRLIPFIILTLILLFCFLLIVNACYKYHLETEERRKLLSTIECNKCHVLFKDKLYQEVSNIYRDRPAEELKKIIETKPAEELKKIVETKKPVKIEEVKQEEEIEEDIDFLKLYKYLIELEQSNKPLQTSKKVKNMVLKINEYINKKHKNNEWNIHVIYKEKRKFMNDREMWEACLRSNQAGYELLMFDSNMEDYERYLMLDSNKNLLLKANFSGDKINKIYISTLGNFTWDSKKCNRLIKFSNDMNTYEREDYGDL